MGGLRMKTYNERITECIEYLLSIRFPCEDWKEDKVYFDKLEKEFSEFPADEETKVLHKQLMTLIQEKRISSLNYNKSTEELFAGWNDE